MIRDALRGLGSGTLGTIGLIAFVVAFVAVVLYALTLSKRRREHLKNLPLEDDDELPPLDDPDTPRP